jgi:hypothetical protein
MMVSTTSTFFLAIPSQLVSTRFIVVKSTQENCKQEFDQQHGLKSRRHLLVFYGAGVVYFASEMKALKEDYEHFEIFPQSHIYSIKSG